MGVVTRKQRVNLIIMIKRKQLLNYIFLLLLFQTITANAQTDNMRLIETIPSDTLSQINGMYFNRNI